jgi:glycogen operon protein
MVAFRRAHLTFSTEQFYAKAEIRWFSVEGRFPNWTDLKESSFACEVYECEHSKLYLMFNAGSDALEFILPGAPTNTAWRLAVDTAHETPQGFFSAGSEPCLENPGSYRVAVRSSVVLLTGRRE